MVDAGRQRDFRAQVRCRDLQAELDLVLRHRFVHSVDEDNVRLAGAQACFDDFLEEMTSIDLAALLIVLRRYEIEHAVVLDSLHEFVGQQNAVVEVQCTAIVVAAWFTQLDEFDDFRVPYGQVDCC